MIGKDAYMGMRILKTNGLCIDDRSGQERSFPSKYFDFQVNSRVTIRSCSCVNASAKVVGSHKSYLSKIERTLNEGPIVIVILLRNYASDNSTH